MKIVRKIVNKYVDNVHKMCISMLLHEELSTDIVIINIVVVIINIYYILHMCIVNFYIIRT